MFKPLNILGKEKMNEGRERRLLLEWEDLWREEKEFQLIDELMLNKKVLLKQIQVEISI